MTDKVHRYLERHRKQAELARTLDVPDHRVGAAKDWRAAFVTRPGSPDWEASCICGWNPKMRYYGETEALAAGGRHLQDIIRKKQAGA